MKSKILTTLLLSLLVPVSLMASPRSVMARKAEEPPVIDGRVDEAQWNQAAVASEFFQQRPVQGAPASEQTEVRFLYTEDTLYIGVICFDSEPDRIVDTQSQRDGNLDDSDSILIVLDTYHDRQSGFLFGTNPAGIQYDAQILNEGVSGGEAAGSGGAGRSATSTAQRGNAAAFNLNWDTTWRVQSSRTERGWEAEMAIPLNSLRYRDSSEPQSWGVNMMRNIRRKNEQVFWSEIPQAYNIYRLSLAGDLESLDIHSTRNLKFIPYALAGVQRDFTVSDTDFRHDIGFDVKYGISSAMTLDVTVNTDFAQVEADNEQINLTRFPLFFPEKRDFFLENAGTFAFGTPREVDLFFSRRIGLENGLEIPIRAGARFSGKLDRFQVGLLSIQTGEEEGLVPSTNFFVGRIRREFKTRNSVGFIFTNRQATGDSQSGKPEYNRAWGTDLQLGLGDHWIISTYVAQTDSPDLPEGDDWAGNFAANYQSNLWRILSSYTEVQDNFNPEMGFVQRKGFRRPQFRMFFNPSPETGPIKRWNPHWSIRRYYDFEGELETERLHHDFEVFFRNGGNVSLVWNRNFELLRFPFEIHPGVIIPAGEYTFSEYEISAASDPSARIYGNMALSFGQLYAGDLRSYDFILGFRTGPNFITELNFINTGVDADWGRFNTSLGRLRVNYSFTTHSFIQGLIQYNSRGQLFSSNIRLGFTKPSGTGLYLVYNDAYSTPGELFDPLGRSFFVKYSHQFDF
jgi:hypothetical protein